MAYNITLKKGLSKHLKKSMSRIIPISKKPYTVFLIIQDPKDTKNLKVEMGIESV
jgi:hypothetical protein